MKLGFGSVLAISVVVVGGLFALLYFDKIFGFAGPSEEPLMIYCAAGLREPVAEVARQYEDKYGVKIEMDYAGSGTLLSKIRGSSSGDLYLAADNEYLETARGFDLIDEVLPLARQKVVIAVKKGNPKGIRSVEDLLREDVRVSLADPEAAAIGKVSRAMLQQTDQWDAVWKAKKVARDTVNYVANDVKTDAADAGLIWDATADQYAELEYVAVARFDENPKRIAVAVLRASEQPAAALRFARYMTAPDKGLAVLKEYGYDVIDGDPWAEKPELVVFSGGVNRVAVDQVIRDFEQREGVTVIRSYKGCGVLVAEMKAGLLPDVYFACDVSFMDAVEQHFGESVVVTSTDMVLIASKDNPKKIETLADLARDDVDVGLCNPDKSALGHLCQVLLEKDKYRLWDKVFPVTGDQPATADVLVQHVVIGSLDAAIVYRANTVEQKDKLTIIEIDDPDAKADQPIAIGTKAKYKHLAERLMARIRSAESRGRFEENGFDWLGKGDQP